MLVKSLAFIGATDAAIRSRIGSHHASVEDYTIGSVDLSNFITSWNYTMGPPPRRWYKAKFGLEYSPETNDNIIKKSGENGETTEDFDFGALTKDHYCRYREAGTEREGQCCTEEDDHCYTKAGCYCDVACFTVYGDCCTDHFVTCYEDLSLCLKKVNNNPQTAIAKELQGVNQKKNDKKLITPRMQFDSNSHVVPNACCGQTEYNDGVECCHKNANGKKVFKIDAPNSPCAESSEYEYEETEEPEE